jgi:hypothetical protein
MDQVGGKSMILTSEGNFMPTNRWAYVSVVFDTVYGDVTIYVDGDPYATTVLFDRGSVAPSESDMTIGATADGSHFQGHIDEVELYNRGLSRAELELIIATRETGKCSGGLEVTITVSPSWAPQAFDILLNGKVKVDDLVGGGTTGEMRVLTGMQTIDITDADGLYAIGATTTYECRDAGDLIIRRGGGGALTELPINNGDSITCTMRILVEDPGPPPPPAAAITTEPQTTAEEPATAEPPPPAE